MHFCPLLWQASQAASMAGVRYRQCGPMLAAGLCCRQARGYSGRLARQEHPGHSGMGSHGVMAILLAHCSEQKFT